MKKKRVANQTLQSDNVYIWDHFLPDLLLLFNEVWGHEIPNDSARRYLSTVFAMRAMRRLLALDLLFKKGYYTESHSIVRTCYEDWLKLSYVLLDAGDERTKKFWEYVPKCDYKVHKAFAELCGIQAAERFFGPLPESIAKYVNASGSSMREPKFDEMAEDVGLLGVHKFVYTYLSCRSHPDPRTNELFHSNEEVGLATIPKRNDEEESRLAIWALWITSRIESLAAKEHGVAHESFSDFLLQLRIPNEPNLEVCVMVKEYRL